MKFTLAICALSIFSLTSCNTNNLDIDKGLVIKESPYDFDTTYTNLRTIINTNPNLKILLELDHSKNAASVNLKLNQTRIILFGNPKLGTLLMQNSSTASIDLPQKIIVYMENDSKVKIAYNNPTYLKARHLITDNDEVLNKISNALDKITNAAISPE